MSVVAFCLANAAAAMQVRPRPPVKDAAEVARRLWSQSYLYDTDEHATIRVRPTAGEPSFRMAYMPIRNRGELPRLILEEAQCSYELEVVGYKTWRDTMKRFAPDGKCPVLWDYDGNGADQGHTWCTPTPCTFHSVHC